MKVKIDLDIDIELSEDGQRLSLGKLLKTAQASAINAAQKATENVSAAGSASLENEPPAKQGQPASEIEADADGGTATKDEDGSSTHNAEQSDTGASSPFQTELNSPTLHPLGVFLCDLLDRAAEVSRQVNDQTGKTQQRPDGS